MHQLRVSKILFPWKKQVHLKVYQKFFGNFWGKFYRNTKYYELDISDLFFHHIFATCMDFPHIIFIFKNLLSPPLFGNQGKVRVDFFFN